MNKSNLLRKRLAEPGIILSPGVYDCLSAKIAERTGFEVLFTSGFGISGSLLGYPDYGLLTATEMLNAAGNISQSVNIPLIADIDTGYGNPVNVVRTIKDVVNLGIAGVILEDQMWPKRCGHLDGKHVITMEEHVEKIRAARFASGESGLVIVARTDARAELGLEEATRRGKAYYEAGADIIFIEAPQTEEELKKIPSALPNEPLLANMIEGGKTPCLNARELEENGFKIGVFALSGLFAATRAIEDCFRFLKENGTTSGFENISSFQDYKELINIKKYKELEENFLIRKPSS
ncbi:2,3-dimethylmalate lyase [Candidatus Scalindua japonica]|uniref:2,3-dimethylmalate lyase n=1 Tax=Candidatus Scalindua japonica TaxID=1284222 RepID=A0A286U1I3_9BACT|nr:isocitrate lyase/PEP mutase family protein [Candidatus Scalindua japonica]GAX61976.1 2,3-dimethylmalate lyase [Candidatus Scalindua japonica]